MPTTTIPTHHSLGLFEQYKQAINQSLTAYFEQLPGYFSAYDLPPIAKHALELIAEYTLRPGKRVRGGLASMTYDHITRQELSQNGQQLAVAMELIQSYALIVDDVTDKSDLRRGLPTVHRLYEQYNSKIKERDAEQLATNTGLIAGHLANLALLNINEATKNLVRAVEFAQKNIIITSFGQLDDIFQEIGRKATTDEIIRKYALKTSYYTFINPLHAGMALAGITDQNQFDELAQFGEAAGVAFQAHDDYLGVFGGSETGKPNTDDIREGKLTILTQYALEHGSADDVATLKTYLGNQLVGKNELAEVKSILARSGATMEAQRIAKSYAEKALEMLEAITIWDDSFKAGLAELVTYSITRKS